MKRLSFVLVALGLTTSAFASLPAATDPSLINVPQLSGGFVIGATYFYLQPTDTDGDLDYAIVSTGNTNTFTSEFKNINPSYEWAWGFNLGYIFPGTGNDINASYFQFDNADRAATTQSVNTTPVTDYYTVGKAEYNINQIDLTVGQYINVGCRLRLHPNVGMRWADIERKDVSSLDRVPNTGTFFIVSLYGVNDSDFDGLGPLTGLDASYYLGMGFGAVAHFDSALLIGTIDDRVNSTLVTDGEIGGTAINQSKDDNTRHMVPVIDAKLGLDYTYLFNNAANSDITLEAGWQFTHYYNVIDNIFGGINNDHISSDLGMNGPYVTLVFHA